MGKGLKDVATGRYFCDKRNGERFFCHAKDKNPPSSKKDEEFTTIVKRLLLSMLFMLLRFRGGR